MPRGRVIAASEDDEDYQSQSQTDPTQLSAADMKDLAGKICNYLIMNDFKKIPSKKADLRKYVMKGKGRHFSDVMADANLLMKKVYGYNIVRLKNNDSYILLNDLKYNNDLLESTTASSSDELISLLTIILSAIFMSGGVMQESSLNKYLKTFHIELGSRSPHPVFGNVDKLIHQDWARQCYLEIILDKMMDPPKREYKWGERAHLEFPKKWMLELVCKVYGDDIQPEMWTAQWKQVQDNP